MGDPVIVEVPKPSANPLLSIWVPVMGLCLLLGAGIGKAVLRESHAATMVGAAAPASSQAHPTPAISQASETHASDKGGQAEFWSEIAIFFVAEAGVAVVIAWLIGVMFDKRKQELEDERAERDRLIEDAREEQMIQNVFRGVLGIEHTREYVNAVIETNLRQNVIRGRVTLVYVIREDTNVGDEYIELDQSVTYELVNKSNKEQKVDVKFTLPIPYMGSNFEHSKVYEATIVDRLENPEIESAMKEFDGIERRYRWTRTIPPRGKLNVLIKAKVIRRIFDNDIWFSFYPCAEGMSLHVVAPTGFHMWIRNNTPTDVFPEKDTMVDGIGEWHINGPILPNNFVELWWRKGGTPPDDQRVRV